MLIIRNGNRETIKVQNYGMCDKDFVSFLFFNPYGPVHSTYHPCILIFILYFYFVFSMEQYGTLYTVQYTHTSTIRIIQSNNKLMHNIEFRHSNCMVKAGF